MGGVGGRSPGLCQTCIEPARVPSRQGCAYALAPAEAATPMRTLTPLAAAHATRATAHRCATSGRCSADARLLRWPLAACREGLSPEAVEGWESMLYHIKGLAPVVDDLSGECQPGAAWHSAAAAAAA